MTKKRLEGPRKFIMALSEMLVETPEFFLHGTVDAPKAEAESDSLLLQFKSKLLARSNSRFHSFLMVSVLVVSCVSVMYLIFWGQRRMCQKDVSGGWSMDGWHRWDSVVAQERLSNDVSGMGWLTDKSLFPLLLSWRRLEDS